MDARARSERRSGGGGADAGPRGFQQTRRGRAPAEAEGRYGEEEQEGAVEAGDGTLRSLACMLSHSRRRPVARAQAGFSRGQDRCGARGEGRSVGGPAAVAAGAGAGAAARKAICAFERGRRSLRYAMGIRFPFPRSPTAVGLWRKLHHRIFALNGLNPQKNLAVLDEFQLKR